MIEALLVAAFVDRWQPVEEMKPPTLPQLVVPTPTEPAPPAHAHVSHHVKRSDICSRTGGHRVNYTKNHWGYWRCVYP